MLYHLSVFLGSILVCLNGAYSQQGQSNSSLAVVLGAELDSPAKVAATMVVLTFPPGDTGSDPHTHPGPVTGYILKGEFLFQVDNELPRILKGGEAFSEKWGAVHVWSANASNRTTCKVVATVWGEPGKPVLTFVPNYPRVTRLEALRVAKANRAHAGR